MIIRKIIAGLHCHVTAVILHGRTNSITLCTLLAESPFNSPRNERKKIKGDFARRVYFLGFPISKPLGKEIILPVVQHGCGHVQCNTSMADNIHNLTRVLQHALGAHLLRNTVR